ncbi:lichenan-specific phosphotransferase enzyme IIA component [Oceanobacillus sp. J11TS1]|nr:lichenan-specific phosphotransferase enzyme IIA component [Oceanobacillus sp. J11TS1]
MSVEEISFQIILYGGNARTLAMEAMKHAKASEFELAEQKIEEANEEMSKAHRYQTDLIQGEIRGEEVELRLLLIHAQDHLMNAITVIDLAQEVIELHKKINLSKGDYYVKS